MKYLIKGIGRRLHRESDIVSESEKVPTCEGALNDQELEIGPRTVTAPIRDASHTVTAINISASVGRTTVKEHREDLVPQLLATTRRVNSIRAKRSSKFRSEPFIATICTPRHDEEEGTWTNTPRIIRWSTMTNP
jgi:hypothetical protein